MLRILFFVRIALRRDLFNYGNSLSSATNTSLAYKRLKEEGYINTDEFDGLDTVKISEEGLSFLRGDSFYFSRFLHKPFIPHYASDSKKALRKKLGRARAMITCASAGIKVFPDEKPTFYELFLLMKEGDKEKESGGRITYYLEGNKEEILETIHGHGFYYSPSETREWIRKMMGDGVFGSEQTKQSRFSGVIVKDDQVYVLYVPVIGKNRMMRWNRTYESSLKTALSSIMKANLFTDTFRVQSIPGFPLGDVYSIVIPEGNAMCYEMVMGYRHGKIKVIREKAQAQSIRHVFERYDATDTVYPRCFITPVTKSGIGQLRYLLEHSPEKWLSDVDSFFHAHKIKGFLPSSSRSLTSLGFDPDDRPLSFLPLLEIKILDSLSKASVDLISIVTTRDLADTISHSIRKDILFYNRDTGEKIDADMYDMRGIPFNAKREKEYERLRKRKGGKRKRAIRNIYLEEQIYELLKKRAREKGTTMTKVAGRMIREGITAKDR